MRIVPDDGLHGVPQRGEDKSSRAGQDIEFLFSRGKTVYAPSGRQNLCAFFLFAKLGLEVHIVINDRADFLCNLPARFPRFYLRLIYRIMFFFSPVQIPAGGDQFPDAFRCLAPCKGNLCIRLADTAGADSDAFRVMPFVQLSIGCSRICAAYAVFLFEKCSVFLRAFLFQKLLIDAEFSV